MRKLKGNYEATEDNWKVPGRKLRGNYKATDKAKEVTEVTKGNWESTKR